MEAGQQERTDTELLELWETAPLAERDSLVAALQERNLIPQGVDDVERDYGLYPSIDDPLFTQKLLQKREFSETKQDAIKDSDIDTKNPCDPEGEFELTAVQRFVGRFMSPECPYYSALLYHGVGVGKTCAAVTIAENHLRLFPRKPVFIIAPRTIQPGFKRTIFDDEALKIGEDEDPNISKGCTGNSYLKRTGTEYEREKAVVGRRVNQAINARYKILGYTQFYRYIEDVLKNTPRGLEGEEKALAEIDLLRREFSGRMVIIDEAHNLRDNPREVAQENIDAAGDTELTETQAGKRLTPSLLKVLDAAEGLKLVLLTGTPMYNSHVEIVFLLNLLLRNDKKATISEKDIFSPTGFITREGKERLGAVASRYVSFMRGENPLTFPVRLRPKGITLDGWASIDLKGQPIAEKQRTDLVKLPFVGVQFEGDALDRYTEISEAAAEKGLTLPSLDEMTQRGNWIFPDPGGFEAMFEERPGTLTQYAARDGPPTWLLEDSLASVSPKAAITLKRAATCNGLVFVYSRFIKSGAVPLALALEANGYTAWNRDKPLLADGIQDGKGRQCALCVKREKEHAGQKHRFTPAKYILVTGQAGLSPNNGVAIQAARAKTNMNGGEVKIVIGSQVASEGVDFRFVREIYVFDSWFHLNKMEQVLGRGIRTCSHASLPADQRNCMIHLLVNTFEGNETETADMYMYRMALMKAAQTGVVTRTLKEYAIDCNLNRDAIVISGLKGRTQKDSQGMTRQDVTLNDTPFTNICDWIETCDYQCKIPVTINTDTDDISSYDDYAARWHESQLKQAIKTMFESERDPIFRLETITEIFSAVPPRAIASLLTEIVGNKSFRLRIGGVDGYVVYRNGYYLFQPIRLADTRIPLAMRIADVPVKRDFYEPGTGFGTGVAAVAAAAAATRVAAAEAASEAATEATEGPVYWGQIRAWAALIAKGEAPLDVPPEIRTTIRSRFTTDDDRLKEEERFVMVSWLYEDIRNNAAYSDENRAKYREALATVLLEYAWDESLKPAEQQAVLAAAVADDAVPSTETVAVEQRVQKGTTKAFRYIDVLTGIVKYVCETGPCSDAVARVFESDTTDPLVSIKVNTATTAPLYGFMVHKGKERSLVFKTSSPPPVGGKVEKGGECAIVSTIAYHIKMLKDIAEILKDKGYPALILRDDVLDEKERRKAHKKSTGITIARNPNRSFENAIRACALKDLILRWADCMERGRPGGLRFFYRPLASLKSGHKGSVAKA